MIRRVLAPIASIAIAAGSFTAGAIAPPAATAGQPNWTMQVVTFPGPSQPGGTPTVGPLRLFLQRVTISNLGPSNIPDLTLAHGTSAYPVQSATPSQGACAATALSCSLGALSPGAPPVVVDVVYQAPASGAVAVEYVVTTVGDAEQGNASRGYALAQAAITLVNASGDFDGAYLAPGGNRSVATTTELSLANQHSTRLVAPPWAVAATVADLAAAPCPVAVCIGQASELKLYGTPPSNPPIFSVVIGFHASELPKNVNQSTLRLYHTPDAGPGYEIPRCARTPVAPCFTAVKLRDGSIEATVLLVQNGVIRGW